MPLVNGHPVTRHGIVDLLHDGGPGGLDPQSGGHLVRVVRRGLLAHDPGGGQHLPQVVALDEELVPGVVGALRVVDVDDGTVDGGQALDHDGDDLLLQELQLVVHGGLAGDPRTDGDQGVPDDRAVLGLDLESGRAQVVADALGVDLELEQPDPFDVQLDQEEAIVGKEDLL